jgi:hypothetical protein
MRNKLNKISAVLIFLLVLIGCGSDDTYHTIRGAELGVIEIVSPKFNVCDPASSYSMTIEVEDHEDGDLLDNVTVYVSFIDKTYDGITYPATEEQLTAIDASAFTEGPNGLPITTFAVTLEELTTFLGLDIDSYDLVDLIRIRFEINLTDGRSFTNDNGPMYVYEAGLECASFDEPDFFTGQYLMEQLSGSDPFFLLKHLAIHK